MCPVSYTHLYLLDYLRKYHPDKVSDTYLIAEREEAAATTFEKERSAGSLSLIHISRAWRTRKRGRR